jgi:hypothetical protein
MRRAKNGSARKTMRVKIVSTAEVHFRANRVLGVAHITQGKIRRLGYASRHPRQSDLFVWVERREQSSIRRAGSAQRPQRPIVMARFIEGEMTEREKLKREIQVLGQILQANAAALASKTMKDHDRELLQRQVAVRTAH